MKKTLFPALAAIGLLLSACGTLPPSQVTPGSADDGIVLRTQFPVYAPDVPFIQFTIENNSGDMAEYGTPWTLERLEDDGWYTIPFAPDTGWTMPLFMLPDGGISSDTVHLSMLDRKLKEGTYRIIKEINDIPYAAEFSVGDAPVGKDAPYGYMPIESLPVPYTAEMALADGAVIPGESADLSRFFDDMAAGMNTQVRICQPEQDGASILTDITAEYLLGQARIRYSTGDADRYYAYFVSDGDRVALSTAPVWDAADADMLILDSLSGNASARNALMPQDETAIIHYRRAAVWSEDGSQLLTLSSDVESPMEFYISRTFPGGGGEGHTVMLDTPGMKAIRSARWTDEHTVMLICDVEDSDLSDITGYVFYDTAEDKVLSYTQSQHQPQTDADGTILIPE